MHLALGVAAGRTPLLHEETVSLSAPTQAWSRRDGAMDGPSHGLFHGGWRWVRSVELRVDGGRVEHRSTGEEHGWTVFRGAARQLDGGDGSSKVLVERMRGVDPGGLIEKVTLVNGRDVAVTAALELVVTLELAPIDSVRDGMPTPVPIALRLDEGAVVATDGLRSLRCSSTRGALEVEGSRITVSRSVVVAPGDWSTLSIEIEIDDPQVAAPGPFTAALPALPALRTTGRPALDRWAARAAADLEDLSVDVGHGPFPAAAAPWQMALLSRDALIAARLTLPSGAAIAEGTLRTLATRQGVMRDATTGEEPGRIPDELRQDGPVPTAVFRSAVDATPLWIVLLHEAWVAGMSTEGAREARTALHAALRWLESSTGDGFLEDPEEDGPRAGMQAIAFRAAMGAADLLDALGDDGDTWREWARRLAARFRAAFWFDSSTGRRLVTALGRDGAPNDQPGAELGELLGTGLLNEEEEAIVARMLLDDRISSGFGLRALADDADATPELDPRRAVRPHQTGIAIEGMLRSGLSAHARALAERLLAGADAFQGRLPAAFAVDDMEHGSPVLLPDTSSLHAASAASVVVAHRALDVPTTKRRLAAVDRLPGADTRSSGGSGAERAQRVGLRLVEPEG